MGQGTAAHAYDPPIVLYDELVGPNEQEVQRQLKNPRISDNPKPGHDRIRAHKIADFGLSIEVPDPKVLANDQKKVRAWTAIAEGRNTYHAPEQDFIDHPNRKIGHKTDLWNSALLIFMCMNNAKSFPRDKIFETGVDPEPSRIFKTMGERLLHPDREIYSRKLRGTLLTALAYDPDDRWEVKDVLEVVQEVLEHWNFGDEDDLFLGNLREDGRGWGGSYPDFSWSSDEDRGMTMLHPESKRADSMPGCINPVNWNAIEDEDDFADVGLLFPSRTDIRKGYREVPFEEGQAERPHPLFPSWRRVGKDGKPKRYSDSEDEEEEEEEEDKTKSITSNEDSSDHEDKPVAPKSKSVKSQRKSEPRKIAGVKRMRSARRKRQRRESPKKTPIRASLEYFVNDSGTVVQHAARPMRKEGEGDEILERSAPWIPVQPLRKARMNGILKKRKVGMKPRGH
ncbi:hypothetical protein DID88_009961 [Monilinia fructigena]|uniref:Protein kinase domain-containing protein n=1 Tax=Monilinia fructigena TaxID=38457 RepID=A0A395IMN5_9HELO|nr:hypothetical protein DID88_009961 [Monilinia fructigena]